MAWETSRLAAAYRCDAAHFEAGEKPVFDLSRPDEPAPLVATQELSALCRRDIVLARIKLADPRLTAVQQRELWWIVDCREWFLKIIADDFHAELEQIDREIEHELRT